ncbi:hypothetical protein ACQKWADRAFT_321719 [Trichoderma austrokoningii]
MSCQQPPPQAGQALQLQLTSHMGGSNMPESVPDDASYRRFEADIDSALETPTQSHHRSCPLAHPGPYATTLDSLPISHEQSLQLPPELSYAPGFGHTATPSDWLQHQTSVANDHSLIFSSSSHSHHPGQSHYPQMAAYDAPLQLYERGDGQRQPGPSYPEDQFPHQPFEDGFQNIPATLPFNPLGQPQAYSFSQPDAGTHAGYCSNGSTPTATCSGIKDMVPDLLHSANIAHEGRYSVGSSGFCLPASDGQLPPDLETTNSYYSPETDTLSLFEPTDNKLQVPGAGGLRSRRYTASHHGTSRDTIQQLPPRRSLSTRPPNRRPSSSIAPLQPKPQKNVAGDAQRNGFSLSDIFMPRKGRGKRTKPLDDGKREAATRRRNERTVCIGCKSAKVVCEGREHGGNCGRCSSSQNNAPKPFVCVPASFIELVQQGSTMLLALCTIYSRSSNGLQAISLPFDIDVRQLLGSISDLQGFYSGIRVYEGGNILFELDLQGCWAFINANYPPTTHPFRQFIDGLKFQRQGHWKACIKNSTQVLANLCETLFTWDDAAPYITYSAVYEIGVETEGRVDLDPSNEYHERTVLVAAHLYRIIGRQLELQFYDYLKKALSGPNFRHEVVLEVGRAIISLRRRLASCAQNRPWPNAPCPPEIEDSDISHNRWGGSIAADRVRKICLTLYVYFCYMRRRLPLEEQGDLHMMEVRDPENDRMEQVHLPQYESIKGFEDWLQFNMS